MENKEIEIKIGIFGSGGIGKSTITIRFLKDIFVEDYDPTITDIYIKKNDLNDKKIKFIILDTALQEEHYDPFPNYVRETNIFVLIYSITYKESFEEIKYFDERIKRILDIEDKDYPKILIGNKSDLTMKREVSIKEGKELAKKLNCKFIETSAKTGENINQLFYETILLEIERLKTIEEENLNQKKKKKKNKKGKCFLM
ncbi:ras-like protein [Anaeramoeba ignava]|uniref:Ras-like protein n=1 Tax=Anaeramoeba ignava TaxID=1746090 RepID=A0A9Q0LC61_ANAIG|nr:ras-like protein [Anaeramoeba ignava]